jgi:uncharacterized iron-regulated membrane protein
MNPDFTKSMIWLHTHSGLVLGWLLFIIFLTGSLSYFNPEISQWMKPELVNVTSTENLINRSLIKLHQVAVNSDMWRINLPNERSQHWSLQWRHGSEWHVLNLGANFDQVIKPRDTYGGNFFRKFHYSLQLRDYGGRYIVGFSAMFMLVAVFSGIFTHRRLFSNFFTLRLGKLLTTLTDFHALAGLVTGPFIIMVCSSGIMIYAIMYLPFSADHFAGGQRNLSRALSPGLELIDRDAPTQLPLSEFTVVQNNIEQHWQGQNQIRRITFEQPFSREGRIIVDRVKNLTLSKQAERLVFSSHDGKPLQGYAQASNAAQVRRFFFGLHEAQFADIGLRWLLFLLGLLTSALIASGLIIWLNKRLLKVKQPQLGHFVAERLNIAVIGGLPLAIVAFFLSNRLLPKLLEGRAVMEVQVFFLTWMVCVLVSLFRPAKKAWVDLLLASAFGCYLLPIIDLYQDSQRIRDAILEVNLVYLTFVLFILLMGFVFMKSACWLRAKDTA